MADNISSLKISVDSSEVKNATNNLNNLTSTSGKAEKGVNTLRNAFATIGAGALAKQFIDTADSLKLLDARLKLATDSTKEFKSQQEQLLKISLQSYTAYGDTVTLFTKLNPALKQVEASTEQVNSVISSFTKGLQLGGSSAAEASSAILQFSQAMGSGVLRGEEFNAIAEASPKLMSYLAKGMGVAQGELRKMAANGELTAARVSNALLEVKDTIDKDFATLPVTVAKAMTNLSTATSLMVQDIDKSLGATDALAGYISDLSNAINSLSPEELQQIVDLVKNSAIAFGTAAASITLAKGAMTLYTSATNGAFTATTLLRGALNTIPFAIIVTGITAIATSLLSASKSSETLEKTLKSTNEELKKLTKNQLAYRQELLEEEIVRSRLIMADAKARAGKSSANAEDKANRDEAIKNFEEQTRKLRELKELQKDSSLNSGSSSTINADLKTKRNEVEIIKLLGSEYQKFNLALDESVKKAKELGASEAEINEFRAEELKKFNEKQEKSNKEAIKSTDELNNALKEMSQVGMNDYQIAIESIKEKTAEWIVAGANYNEVIAKQKQLMEELNLQNSLSIASEQLSFLEKKAQLMTDEYEKAKLLLELKYAQNLLDIEGRNIPIEDKQRLIEQETELYNLTLQRIELDRDTEFQETMINFQDDMLERQLELNNALYEFGDTYQGVGGKISKVAKEVASFANAEIKAKKEREKLDKKYEKDFAKYAKDVEKTKELEQQYSKDTAQINQMAISNQIDGYSNLAGAIAGLYEEGSSKAKQWLEIQKILSVVSGVVAIASAMANGDGYTAVARGLAVAATLVSFGWSKGGSGSGGGGSSSKSYSQTEIDKFNIEAEYTPMIGRLDRQIELLEKIERNGSAGAIKVDLAGTTFEKDYKLLVNEFLPEIHNKLKPNWGDWAARASNENQFEGMLGFNLGDMVGKNFVVDKNSLKQDLNLMKLVETINANWDYFHNSGFGVLLDKDWKKAGDPMSMTTARIGQITNDMQELLHEYTMSLLDSMQDLKDAKEEYISIYEELTDSRVFTDKKLADAFKSFDSLLATGESYADYIYKEINNLQNLEKFLTNDKIEILLSQDPTNLRSQLDLLDELKKETGLTFQNGARDAIDFLESIKLVSEALVTSRNNINSFVESFMSDYDLLEMQSQKMGTGIAKSFDELFLQFQTMASDVVGLTDEELSYLEATKSYLEEQNNKEIESIEEQIDLQEKLLDTIENNIRTIEGIMNSLKSTIDKLRDSADTTNTYTLNKFYESMAKTQELMKGKDYEAISKSVQKTISYSSALSDAKNFTLTRDMQFAQLAAARQFEEMDITLQSEVDYLREIEINTKDTVSRLEDMIEALGATITNAFDKNSQAIKNLTAELEKSKEKDKTEVAKLVDKIYTKYDLHKYQTDDSGYKHWENQVLSGAIPVSQLETAIKNTAEKILSGSSGGGSSSSSGGSTPSTSDLISNIYTKYNLHQYQTDDSGYKHWEQQVNSGAISVADLESVIKDTAEKILGTPLSFAVGTPYVERDMVAKIHQGEIITPKNFSDGLRNGDLVMGQTANMVNAINNMGALLSQNVANLENKLNAIISITGTQVNKLDDIYDVSNGSLVSLQNIEGII